MDERGLSYRNMKVVAVAAEMLTAYGFGAGICWENIFGGKTAISEVDRFDTAHFQSGSAATVKGLKYHQAKSLVVQMLEELFHELPPIPYDADLIVATTKGEIDLLEQAILSKRNEIFGDQAIFLGKVASLTGIAGRRLLVSCACSSSAAAVARAASMIRNGRTECVLVVACDAVTEFVFSGFSSLMALDPYAAMPFDLHRNGLSLGEAAAFVLLMSERRAYEEKREVLGEVAGWGLSDDANHMTGPSRSSDGLIMAIEKAISAAEISREAIGFISAHGTGTIYNDAMEMRAFRAVFREEKPVYSIKGGTGHTMGAAGLLELIIAMKALREKKIPPTVNLREPGPDAEGWVSTMDRSILSDAADAAAVMTNAGFGGVNAAVVLR